MMIHDTPKYQDILSQVGNWLFAGTVLVCTVVLVAVVAFFIGLGLQALGWWSVLIPVALFLVILLGKFGVEKWDMDL